MSKPRFDKVAGLEPGNLFKKDSSTGAFCGFLKSLWKAFLLRASGWLFQES